MLRRYALSIVVVVIFVVLLAVVLLTQPKSDSSSTTPGAVSAATGTPNADATKLQIIQLAPDDTVNRLVVTEPSAALPTPTTIAATGATTTVAASATVTVTSTPTPFVPLTPGQLRKLQLNLLPPKNTWTVAGQPDFPLDSNQVASTIQLLSNLNGVALLPSDSVNNLAQYGLDKPSLTIMLESVKGGKKTLDVGNANPVTQNYWVKLENDNRIWTLAPDAVTTFKGWLDAPPLLPPTPVASPSGTLTPGSGSVSPGTASPGAGASAAVTGTVATPAVAAATTVVTDTATVTPAPTTAK